MVTLGLKLCSSSWFITSMPSRYGRERLAGGPVVVPGVSCVILVLGPVGNSLHSASWELLSAGCFGSCSHAGLIALRLWQASLLN